MSKPRHVWLIEQQRPDGEWEPDMDRCPCRTRVLAAEVAKYQEWGAMKGLIKYRPAKYVRSKP